MATHGDIATMNFPDVASTPILSMGPYSCCIPATSANSIREQFCAALETIYKQCKLLVNEQNRDSLLLTCQRSGMPMVMVAVVEIWAPIILSQLPMNTTRVPACSFYES